ncbi:MAG: RNA-binding protein [Thermoprotei archaeon]|nr:MAG: RNA-binding protein [Thermoprotei archaeon]RLF20897.1 MAG: RNA-binding protein [Thermoprotei archaeon]
MAIYFSQREIVVPGQLLAKGPYKLGSNVYNIGQNIYSSVVGLAELKNNVINVIALKSTYIPSPGDLVIGKIINVGVTSWQVDIASPYTAILQASDAFIKPIDVTKESLRKYFDVGDYIIAKVLAFDKTRDPLLTVKEAGCGRIEKGTVVEINPSKVPRLIGRKGSMISLIKNELGVEVVVGKNGRVWVYSKDKRAEEIAVRIIKCIEREAHISGLTNRIKRMLEEVKKGE